VCDDEQAQMPESSEFQTEGTSIVKPLEAKIEWTRGTSNRLVLKGHRERA